MLANLRFSKFWTFFFSRIRHSRPRCGTASSARPRPRWTKRFWPRLSTNSFFAKQWQLCASVECIHPQAACTTRRSNARALLSSPLLSPESRRYRCRLMPRIRQLWHLYQVRTKGIYQQRLTRWDPRRDKQTHSSFAFSFDVHSIKNPNSDFKIVEI